MDPVVVPHAFAAALGLLLAHRERRFREMGQTIAALLGLSAARILSRLPRADIPERIAAIAAGQVPPPYVGLARVSWAVEQPIVVAWYAVLTWAVWRALKDEGSGGGFVPTTPDPGLLNHPDSNRSPIRISSRVSVTLSRTTASHCRDVGRARSMYLALALLASSVLLFALYPVVRGRFVEVAATIVFCAALTAQLAAATGYVLRWRRPDAARGVALVLVVGSIADAAGPYLMGRPASDWFSGEPVGVLIWGVIGGCELWAIATRSRES